MLFTGLLQTSTLSLRLEIWYHNRFFLLPHHRRITASTLLYEYFSGVPSLSIPAAGDASPSLP